MESKGYCSRCSNKNELERIFVVNSNEEYCTCPNCQKTFLTSDAILAFKNKIISLQRKAIYTFNFKSNYLKAYKMFGNILNYDSGNAIGVCGRIESLLMMSTLRNAKFNDAYDLLDIALSLQLKKIKNYTCFNAFFAKVDKILKKYMSIIKKKLTTKTYFYDSDCLKLYLIRGYETLRLYKLFLNGFLYYKEHGVNKLNIDETIAYIEKIIKEKTTLIGSAYICADGLSYKLVKNYQNNNFNLENDGIKINTKLNLAKLETLYPSENKKVIKDRVFMNNKLKYSLFILSYIGILTFIIVGLVLLALSFVFDELLIPFLSISIVLLVLCVACIISRIIIKKEMKKTILKDDSAYQDN